MNESLTRVLESTSINLGADLFGVADADDFLNPDYQGNKPQDFMPKARSIIIIGVIIPRGAIEELPQGRPEYTNTLMAGTVALRGMAFRLTQMLEREGYRATIVPKEGSEFGYWYANKETLKADISIKYAGYLAGLGSYGYNHLLLLPGLGPRIRMTAIVTDAELTTGKPSKDLVRQECKECLACVKICPVGALHEDGSIDRHKCRDYMFSTLGGLRCGMCIKACPLAYPDV